MEMLRVRIGTGVVSPHPRLHFRIDLLSVPDDVLDAWIAAVYEGIDESLSVAAVQDVVGDIHRCDYADVAVFDPWVVIGSSRSMCCVADGAVARLAALGRHLVNLFSQTQQAFCYTPCHIYSSSSTSKHSLEVTCSSPKLRSA